MRLKSTITFLSLSFLKKTGERLKARLPKKRMKNMGIIKIHNIYIFSYSRKVMQFFEE